MAHGFVTVVCREQSRSPAATGASGWHFRGTHTLQLLNDLQTFAVLQVYQHTEGFTKEEAGFRGLQWPLYLHAGIKT